MFSEKFVSSLFELAKIVFVISIFFTAVYLICPDQLILTFKILYMPVNPCDVKDRFLMIV